MVAFFPSTPCLRCFPGYPGADFIKRLQAARRELKLDDICKHLNQVQDIKPNSQGCEKCLQVGASWVNLRMCMICGNIGCCNSSKNKHSMKHFLETDHAVIQSYEPADSWWYCWVDEVSFEVADAPKFAHP